MKFEIGDRVRVKDCLDGVNLKGKIGTIIAKGWLYDYGVEFDEPLEGGRGHNCNSAGKDGYCRWGFEKELEPVYNCNNKIVITTDGKTTLARLYVDDKVIKTAKAQCAPEDEFDFITGAELAFDRLNSEDKSSGIEKAIKGNFYKVIGNNEPTHFFKIGEIVECVKYGGSVSRYRSETGKVQWINDKDVELVNEPIENHFVPHLESILTGTNFGEIGKETKYIDVVGRKLYTGDVVEIFKNGKSSGDRVIVTDYSGKQFVMGINCSCNDGSIDYDWKVLKKRSYKDVKNGDVVDDIEFIIEEK